MSAHAVFSATMFHRRLNPVEHRFKYQSFYLRLDISKLESINSDFKIIRHNKFGILSIYEGDYLSHLSGNISNKLKQLLTDVRCFYEFKKVELITHPRLFGKVFNPVSFFLCYRQDDVKPGVLVAEVHNTFGERHVYVAQLDKSEDELDQCFASYRTLKDFHVSPFFSRAGEYEFKVGQGESKLSLLINLFQDGKLVFESGLVGKVREMTDRELLISLLKYPGAIFLTLPRIMLHAFKLKFFKGLRVYTKPIASSEMTIVKNHPRMLQRFCMGIFRNYVDKCKSGSLKLNFPDGSTHVFGDSSISNSPVIEVKNYDFFSKSVFSGDIGFGESYVDGDWDTNDLVGVIRFFAENQALADDRDVRSSYLGRVINAIQHKLRSNSLANSQNNISAHYDLSNNLFRSFLDPKMQYSSALFSTHREKLEEAQTNKISEIIKLARIKEGMSVLEVGCGWGGLGIALVKATGCKYTGVTLSQEQKSYFEYKVKEEGLGDFIQVKLLDYRHLEGVYDRVISVEMIEAVGHKYLKDFFNRIDRVLNPKGVLVLQAITIPDNRYKAYSTGCDWIQKFIFPGGHCPSLSAILNASTSGSDLVLETTNNIADSYARTLYHWRKNFNANWDDIKKFNFDERFKRIWNYYLCYCEAGFIERMVNAHQMVFSRQGNTETLASPLIST